MEVIESREILGDLWRSIRERSGSGRHFTFVEKDFDVLASLVKDRICPPIERCLVADSMWTDLFRLLSTGIARQTLVHFSDTAYNEARKMDIATNEITGSAQLQRFLKDKYHLDEDGYTHVWRIENAAVEKAADVAGVKELRDIVGSLFFVLEHTIIAEAKTSGLVKETYRRRYQKLMAKIDERESYLQMQGYGEIKAEEELRSPRVEQIETQVKSQDELERLLGEWLKKGEMESINGDVHGLADALVYASMCAAEDEKGERWSFDKGAVKAIALLDDKTAQTMIDIWLRLGILRVWPKEFGGEESRYYFVSTKVRDNLKALLT